ncbi:hypothetical protein MSIMFI_04676 [Mycobacterium simulans]|nr:hypothetical protein MSIMFI_04676 [Mycobacterium simulans]
MAHADKTAVIGAVDHAQQMADVAKRGGDALRGAREEVLEAIAEAEIDGFRVGEDLSVTDNRSHNSPAERVVRQQTAQTHRSFIAHRAVRLQDTNETIATRLHAGAAQMAGMAPAHWRQPVTEFAGPVPACTDATAPAHTTIDSRRGAIHAVDSHWKQDPQLPAPDDPKDMTEAQARAAWEAVNADIARYNARCGRTFVLPNEQAAYDACMAGRGPLLERQAAIRARLTDLGIPVEAELPPAPDPAGEPQGRGLPPDGVTPPVEGSLTVGPPSRPGEQARGGQSLWDQNGGEWRYYAGDKWHHPHWDYNPHNTPNSRWDNIPIGDLPYLKEGP